MEYSNEIKNFPTVGKLARLPTQMRSYFFERQKHKPMPVARTKMSKVGKFLT